MLKVQFKKETSWDSMGAKDSKLVEQTGLNSGLLVNHMGDNFDLVVFIVHLCVIQCTFSNFSTTRKDLTIEQTGVKCGTWGYL